MDLVGGWVGGWVYIYMKECVFVGELKEMRNVNVNVNVDIIIIILILITLY